MTNFILHTIFSKGFVLAVIMAALAYCAIQGSVDIQGYKSRSTDYIAEEL